MTCEESGGRTTLAVNATSSGSGAVAAAMLKGMDQGWAQTIDRLATQVVEKK